MPFPTQEIIVPFGIFLNQHYGSHYFIWNISEESYDINYFNKQVLKLSLFIKFSYIFIRFQKTVLMDIPIHLYIKFLSLVFRLFLGLKKINRILQLSIVNRVKEELHYCSVV